jgi:hypothetical protein
VADDLKPPASASAESQAIMPPLVAGTLGSGPRREEQQPAHRFRFGFAYLVLAAVVGAAVGTFVLLMDRPPEKVVPWSSWQPSGTGAFQITEIASHVGAKYRLDNGRQLLVAIPDAPSIMDSGNKIPVSGVARRAPIIRDEDDLAFTSMQNGLMYLLCGDASRCALTGQATQARGRLVRREALELALYTFKYVEGVESILTFMPPATGTTSSTTALFYRRSDLAAQLARPVTHTLPARQRIRAGELSQVEGTIVDTLTLPHLFRTQPTQGQDGSLFLVLEPAALSS